MATRLITIPFSHYCEKARWALDRCDLAYEEDGHLPIFAYLPVKRAGSKRTVPVLVDDTQVVPDSTEIIAWADDRRPGALLPAHPDERADALALEDDFDTHLGPATRRWAYFHLLPRRDLDRYLTSHVPRWQRMALKATRPLAAAALKRSLVITPDGAERSRAKIEDTFDRIAKHLADGRRYLIGNAFTVADLTFAALAAPILVPEHHPVPLPPLAEWPDAARAQIDRWRATPAGEFGLRLYRDHRDERMTVVMKRGAV